MMTRGRILMIVSLLVGGVVCAVAVAWGVEIVRAYRVSQITMPTITNGRDRIPAVAAAPTGSYHASLVESFGRSEWHVMHFDSPPEPRGHIPGWVKMPPPTGPGRSTGAAAFGFPFRCLKYDSESWRVDLDAESYQWRFKNSGAWRWSDEQRFTAFLPLKPLWLGLVLDSMVYGALLATPWGLVVLARRVRVGVRIRRGLCPACRYDMRGDYSRACPECGRDSDRTES